MILSTTPRLHHTHTHYTKPQGVKTGFSVSLVANKSSSLKNWRFKISTWVDKWRFSKSKRGTDFPWSYGILQLLTTPESSSVHDECAKANANGLLPNRYRETRHYSRKATQAHHLLPYNVWSCPCAQRPWPFEHHARLSPYIMRAQRYLCMCVINISPSTTTSVAQ